MSEFGHVTQKPRPRPKKITPQTPDPTLQIPPRLPGAILSRVRGLSASPELRRAPEHGHVQRRRRVLQEVCPIPAVPNTDRLHFWGENIRVSILDGWAANSILRRVQIRASLFVWPESEFRRAPEHGHVQRRRRVLQEVNPQPSTLSPQPSTLNHRPSILSPQPSSLNHQPSTLNPQP